MKKIYSFLTLVLVSLLGFTAKAQDLYTITINIDDASHVSLHVDWEPTECVSGPNVFEVEKLTTFQIYPEDGYAISSFTTGSGRKLDLYGGIGSFFVEGERTETEYYVTTVDLNELRTASFTLTLNESSNPQLTEGFLCTLMDYSTEFVPEAGTHTLKFDPNASEPFLVFTTDYGPVYQVTLNGEPVEGDYEYYIYLTDGCNVEITPDFPEGSADFKIVYTDGTDPILLSASYYGNDETINLEVVNGTFSAPYGQYVELQFDESYKMERIAVNGVEEDIDYWWGTLSVLVTEPQYLIEVTAAPYGDINFTLDVDNPEAITFYNGNSYNNDVIELKAGKNELAIAEKPGYIMYKVNSGYVLNGITDSNGNDEAYGVIYVQEGETYTVETSELVLDKTAVIYIDDLEPSAFFYFSVSTRTNTYLVLKAGYNIVPFYDGYNPYTFSWAAEHRLQDLYLNGEAATPMYEGNAYYSVTLADLDVVKIYTLEAPRSYSVTFDVDELAEVEVVRDVIVPVTDFAAPLTVFTNTLIELTPGADDIVLVNGETVQPEDGKVLVTVNADTNIKVEHNQGISNVSVDAAASEAIYNLQGIRVNSLENLPAGVYIRGNQKVVVK